MLYSVYVAGVADLSINLYPRPRIVIMSRCDNTKFNLLRKRFATIGGAGAMFPMGLVSNCSSFFSSPDRPNSWGVFDGPEMKNSLSVKIRPFGIFLCGDVVSGIIFLSLRISSRI